jgi:NTP pyrophosphatase (non-canonical NTP hydrolase)
MGKFKDVGDPAIVLMEEMAEAIQVISKKLRFTGEDRKGWYTKRDGLDDTRWEELQSEMADVFYQWFRLKEEIMGKVVHIDDNGL